MLELSNDLNNLFFVPTGSTNHHKGGFFSYSISTNIKKNCYVPWKGSAFVNSCVIK